MHLCCDRCRSRHLDTQARLAHLGGLLAARGYAADDVDAIMHGNWLRLLRKLWSTYPTL